MWHDGDCKRLSTCGDGVLSYGEDCDDGRHGRRRRRIAAHASGIAEAHGSARWTDGTVAVAR